MLPSTSLYDFNSLDEQSTKAKSSVEFCESEVRC